MKDSYWEEEFFLFQRDNSEKNKKYWEKSFAYYYGWYPGFKVKILNSVMFCKKNNLIVTKLRNILLFFWTYHDKLPNYFFFQILYNELVVKKLNYKVFLLEGDCIPHYLQQLINDPLFDIASFEDILKLTNIHKLTNKFDGCYEKLVNLIKVYYK